MSKATDVIDTIGNQVWDVILNGKVIATVPYESGDRSEDIRAALIADGFDPRISVRKHKENV